MKKNLNNFQVFSYLFFKNVVTLFNESSAIKYLHVLVCLELPRIEEVHGRKNAGILQPRTATSS